MFRRVGVLCAAAGLSLLAGCASGQPTAQTGFSSALPVQQGRPPSTIQPDKGCNGSRHLVVSPCPVVLTSDTKNGIVVTVSGPHVSDSKIDKHFGGCYSNDNCYNVQRVSGSRTQWLFTSGTACDDALVEFHAFNARGRGAGVYFLEISNQYCP